MNNWLGNPDRGSAWTVSVGKRSRRMTIGSSQTTSAPEVTWLSGIIRPATGLQICKLLIAADVVALGQRRAGDDRQQPRLLREDARAAHARLAVEADDAPFKAGFQCLGHFDARDAVAAGLQLEQVGANHLLALAPVAADAHRAAVVFEDSHRLVGELRAAVAGSGPRNRAWMRPPCARAQEKLLGDGVGVGVLLVQMLLDRRRSTRRSSASHRHRPGTARRPGSPVPASRRA